MCGMNDYRVGYTEPGKISAEILTNPDGIINYRQDLLDCNVRVIPGVLVKKQPHAVSETSCNILHLDTTVDAGYTCNRSKEHQSL